MVNESVYWLYFLECENDKIYTGSTGEVTTRFQEHKSGHGSIWTSNNRPTKVIGVKLYPSRSDAYSQERKLKKYSRSKKLNLIIANCFYDASALNS